MMEILEVLIIIFLQSITFSDSKNNVPTTEGLIRGSGYPYEEYKVITADGYILNLSRIPRQPGSMGSVVLLMHFMTGASDAWLLRGPKKDLPYLLHDAGYDIWLGDNRGNCYSRNHTFLSPNELQFWNFSYHELGKYDNRAFVDYILEKTGHEQLIYVGHSMGTTTLFVFLHENPDYNKKIALFIGLGPVAITDSTQQSRGKIVLLRTVYKLVKIWEKRHQFEIVPRGGPWSPRMARALCSSRSIVQALCHDVGFFWVGLGSRSISKSTLENILMHAPAGTTVNIALQYLQNIRLGKFQRLDYGYEGNIRAYGSESPPEYDVTRFTAPVAMYYSSNDYVANATDVEDTMNLLPNVVHKKHIDGYTHTDFMWAKTSTNLVFKDALKLLEKLNLHRITSNA